MVLWLMLLLSATLFNLSFFFLDNLGFLILFSIFLLFYVFLKKNQTIIVVPMFLAGFVWGSVVFSFNIIWLYVLLLKKSHASLFLSAILYLFCVFYYAFITGLFFGITSFLINLTKNLFLKFLSFFVTISCYFYFLIRYSFLLFGRVEGYPFINPFIPLAKCKIFYLLVSFLSGFHGMTQQPKTILNSPISNLEECKIFYLKPVKANKKQEGSPHYYAQKIYQGLCALDLFKYSNNYCCSKKYKKLIVVAPESTFPFPINKHEDQIDFWSNVLPDNAYFLFGSQRIESDKTYQSIIFINQCRIINFYDKKHLILFTEELNRTFKNFSWARNLFLTEKKEICNGRQSSQNKSFSLGLKWCILPQICSEFFWDFDRQYLNIEKANNYCCYKFNDKSSIIFLFVNDSWFMKYFRKIMQNLVYLKSVQYNLPILYIAHKDCFLITS